MFEKYNLSIKAAVPTAQTQDNEGTSKWVYQSLVIYCSHIGSKMVGCKKERNLIFSERKKRVP